MYQDMEYAQSNFLSALKTLESGDLLFEGDAPIIFLEYDQPGNACILQLRWQS